MKIELKVPESLNEISLKQYQKYIDIVNNNTDEIFIAQKMIEIFCHVSLANVVKMKATSINELLAHFKSIFEVERKFTNRFTLEGIDYGFIPNMEEITFEEYVDIEANISDINKLQKALCVMYRPIKETKKDLYTIHDKDYGSKFDEVLRFCPLDVALSAQVFFYDLGMELLQAIPVYLKQKTKSLTISQWKDNSTENGDGITQSLTYLTETLPSLTRLHGKDYSSALHY